MKGIIYKATSPSGKVYIGQTIRPINDRIKSHLSKAFNKKATAYNTKFSKAIRKYGINNFLWHIIYRNISCEKLNILEVQMIAKYDSYKLGYNSTKGGRGSFGLKVSKKVCTKISKTMSGDGNHKAKLNWDQVKCIRKLYNQGYKIATLANKYNISRKTIYDIVDYKTWKVARSEQG